MINSRIFERNFFPDSSLKKKEEEKEGGHSDNAIFFQENRGVYFEYFANEQFCYVGNAYQ